MDDRSFDQLTRALGGASTRRSALAALLGLGVAAGAAPAAGAKKKRRRTCDPACPAGQACVRGACACENGGAPCGGSCCGAGQACRAGTCAAPEQPACIPAGEPCKDTGRVCCDGLTCASGQAGQHDVACRVPAGGACARTADCVFGSTCKEGACIADAAACRRAADCPQPGPDRAGCSEATCTAGACGFSAAAVGAACTLAGTPAATCDRQGFCRCGSLQPTGDAAADGAALRQLVNSVSGAPAIALPAGTYAIAAGTASGLKPGRTLAIEACPGATPTIRCDGDDASAWNCIEAPASGSLSLGGLNVQGPGSTSDLQSAGVFRPTGSGAVTLTTCRVSGFGVGIAADANPSPSPMLLGGVTVTDNGSGLAVGAAGNPDATCSGSGNSVTGNSLENCQSAYAIACGCVPNTVNQNPIQE